jgi:hypothetical protein
VAAALKRVPHTSAGRRFSSQVFSPFFFFFPPREGGAGAVQVVETAKNVGVAAGADRVEGATRQHRRAPGGAGNADAVVRDCADDAGDMRAVAEGVLRYEVAVDQVEAGRADVARQVLMAPECMNS